MAKRCKKVDVTLRKARAQRVAKTFREKGYVVRVHRQKYVPQAASVFFDPDGRRIRSKARFASQKTYVVLICGKAKRR